MSITFANLLGMPVRIARIRCISQYFCCDLTLVSANVNSKLNLFSKTHRARHLPVAEMMLPPDIYEYARTII